MPDRLNRRAVIARMLAALAAPAALRAQPPDEKKGDDEKKADALPGPAPIDRVKLLPDLPTVKVRRGDPTFNLQLTDASLLPRDRQGIWVLDFAFKPLRMRDVEIPGKGRRHVHYLYYRVINRTGKAREFVPQFTVITDTKKRFEEAVIPKAVKVIQAREDPSLTLLGAVDIAGIIPPSGKTGVDDAVFGVAMWDDIDPHADRIQIYVRGLSDGYQEKHGADGKTVVKYKTLRIDLIRRGDERNLDEKEIELADPAYEWVYW